MKLLWNLLLTMMMIHLLIITMIANPATRRMRTNESHPNSHLNSWSSNNTILEVVAATSDAVAAATPLRVKQKTDTEKGAQMSR